MLPKVRCSRNRNYNEIRLKWPEVLSTKCFTLEEPLQPKEQISDFMFLPYENLDLTTPKCFNWTIDQVVKWLREVVQLPQYAEAFISNRINGEYLLFLDANTLPKINIHLFDHIKQITKHIRELFGIDFSRFFDSISLPRAEVIRHLVLYHQNKLMLERMNITLEEFIKQFIYHFPESAIKTDCSWNLIEPTYYLNVAKTKIGKIPVPVEKNLIVNEDYDFDLTIGQTNRRSLI